MPEFNFENDITMKPVFFLLLLSSLASAQKGNDVTAPLHAMQPDYVVPYGIPTTGNVKAVLDRVLNYLDATTPASFVNRKTGDAFMTTSAPDTNITFKQGDFRLTSYEWGVT